MLYTRPTRKITVRHKNYSFGIIVFEIIAFWIDTRKNDLKNTAPSAIKEEGAEIN